MHEHITKGVHDKSSLQLYFHEYESIFYLFICAAEGPYTSCLADTTDNIWEEHTRMLLSKLTKSAFHYVDATQHLQESGKY